MPIPGRFPLILPLEKFNCTSPMEIVLQVRPIFTKCKQHQMEMFNFKSVIVALVRN